MRQSRKTLKLIIAILGTALVASLVTLAIMLLNNTLGQSEVTLDQFIYDDVNDTIPAVKIVSGMVQYQNEAGEWIDLVTLEQLFTEYGGNIGEVLPSATQSQTSPSATTASPSSTPGTSPSPTPTPTNTPNATSTPKATATSTPKATTTVKPTATVKPTTTQAQTPTPTNRTPTPTIKTPTPTTSAPTSTPTESPTGGDGTDITPNPSDDYGGDVLD